MSKTTLYCSLQARIEEIDGEWRAIEDALGLTARGATPDEATSRLSKAIDLLVDALMEHGGVDAVTARFNRAGVVFTLSDPNDQPVRRTLPLMLSVAKSLERV
jgi:predicted RNase H-like HicB family nuclease